MSSCLTLFFVFLPRVSITKDRRGDERWMSMGATHVNSSSCSEVVTMVGQVKRKLVPGKDV